MYLKSISMQGFKSFAKKINIDLSTPVTGVVGPNGSGKSNVAEAIRFVLGEQSMKGLRSKSGSDLIFKGSNHLSPLSRASVSIHLDNKDKKINNKIISSEQEISNTLINFINLDEIILTREIYSDGSGEYLINNTKVRLKDVQELLALANISAAGHTIVNQGEADRILLSNNSERREMIEDALGLRIYHMRIKEGEKKLQKVKNHLNEIELMRRENIPHLTYLKKQVKELEKREEEISGATEMLKIYLYKENLEIENKKKDINHNGIESRIETLEENLNILLKAKKNEQENIENNTKENNKIIKLNLELDDINKKLENINKQRDTLYKEIVNLEIEIKFLVKKQEEIKIKEELSKTKEKLEKYFIEKKDFQDFSKNREILWIDIFNLYNTENYIELNNYLQKANSEEKVFLENIKNTVSHSDEDIYSENHKEDINKQEKEIISLKDKLYELQNLIKNTDKEISDINLEKNNKKDEISMLASEEKEKVYRLDNDILQAKLDLEKLYSQKENIKIKEENLRNQELNFDNLLQEMSVLIGSNAFKYKHFIENEITEDEKVFFTMSQYDLLRKLERSKIKIEESGIINTGEILDEYKSLSERDNFLSTEIQDLESSRSNLEKLIQDLKSTLLLDFNSGLEKINFNFNNYFNEIFKGGKASLSLEKISISANREISNNIGNEIQNNLDDDTEEEKEPGIEISVNLPEKKVKDLQMLSGGERALSSIALIFAMSSINHPPFMVLDETDAALDEANARKYGKMIKKLSEKSKLLVITHNRETMNQCDVLYGVTIGSEGCSKLLSIKFDQAVDYAK